MAKARILVVVIIGVLLLSMLAPGSSLASKPDRPVNLTPDNNTVDIVAVTDFSWTYSDPDAHSPLYKWIQIAVDNDKQTDGGYADYVFDSGPVEWAVQEVVPQGTLVPSTKYYWHVKNQDEYGYWSDWSEETCFTTVYGVAPDQPVNMYPADGTTEISPDEKLKATGFYDPDGYPTADHYAMQILLLKTDPKRFMKTANKRPYDDD